MNFVEGVNFVADFLFIGFSVFLMIGLLISFIFYLSGDYKRTKEEERKEKERADEIDAEIDFIAEKLGYVKKTNSEETSSENME